MFPIEFLRHSALVCPGAVAAVDGHANCTYRELIERSDALGVGIEATTGKKRPVVAILGPNSLEMLIALLSIHASGSVLVPLNGRNSKSELDSQIVRANPDLLIVHRDYLDRFTQSGRPVLIADAAGEDARSTRNLEDRHLGSRPVWVASLGDMNGIKFTGGSSGQPKGVMQSFRCTNMVVANVVAGFELQPADRYLCVAPMTHGAGAMLLPILARGGCIVMTADPRPGNILDLVASERVTVTWMPPTMLYTLIDEQKCRPRNVSTLSHLVWSAAPASPARLREAQQVFGSVIETMYGQTEAPLMLTYARSYDLADEKKLASVGRVAPLVDLAILDPGGRPLPQGEFGEVCVRGDLVMNGYLGMPEETAQTIRDGWLHTGDGGFMDADGYLYLKDRLRDVVISGGFNIYPSDVEAALSRHASVAEVVVFGVPDDHWGERVEAALELRAGCAAVEQDLIDFCKIEIGSIKAPKCVHIVEALPRSPVGKVLRREARAQALMARDRRA